jgi:hypothetical protein
MAKISRLNPRLSQEDIHAFNQAVGNPDVLVSGFSRLLYRKRNMVYYSTRLNSFHKHLDETVMKADIAPTTANCLKNFNIAVHAFIYSTLNFFFRIKDGNITTVNLPIAEAELRNVYVSLNEIAQISSHIKARLMDQSLSDAKFIQQFCDLYFNEALRQLEFYTIDLRESPLRKHLKKIKTSISQSLDNPTIEPHVKTDAIVNQKVIEPQLIFADLIINISEDKKAKFLEELHKNIHSEKGVTFALAIAVLVENLILKVPNKSFLNLYGIIKSEFRWRIGSYNSMQPHYKEFINGKIDEKHRNQVNLSAVKDRITVLVTRYKTL